MREGGAITLRNVSFAGNSVVAGTGGTGTSAHGASGKAEGAGLYLMTAGTTQLEITAGSKTYGDAIGGDGGFTKTGGGALNLTANNTYTGDTVVSEGRLAVNGAIVGDAVIHADGTLGGNGVIGGCIWQPYMAMQYIYLRQDEFQESGADSINLVGDHINANSLRGILGMSLERPFQTGFGSLTPSIRAAWMHEFLDTRQTLQSSFAGAGAPGSFLIRGVDLGRDWAVTGVGLNLGIGGGVSLFGNYDLQFNDYQVFHTGSGGAEFR